MKFFDNWGHAINMKKEDKKILKWRLSEKPSVTAIKELVDSKIITTEEARQIILEETEYNSKSFQEVLDEIKVLRELVLKLSERESKEIIKYIQLQSNWTSLPFRNDYWYQPYLNWCTSQSTLSSSAQIALSSN